MYIPNSILTKLQTRKAIGWTFERRITYHPVLAEIGLDHFDLVLQYSRWVLEKDPKHGMDVSWPVFGCDFAFEY